LKSATNHTATRQTAQKISADVFRKNNNIFFKSQNNFMVSFVKTRANINAIYFLKSTLTF